MRQGLLLIERLHRELARAIDRVLAPEELGLAEWMIVSELAAADAPLTRVARRLARDPGALSRAATRLIKRGLLRSARHEKDRRRATLSLTPRGRVLHDRVAAALDATTGAASASRALPLDRLLSLFPCGDSPATPSASAPRATAASPQRHDPHAPAKENDP
jgi:DNA-binding MarR family transcriptional regulator